MPRGDARPAARDLPAGRAVPDVRADRGVPLDLPRPGRGRPPARLDRQGDPQRRDPGRPAGRLAVRPRRGGRAGAPRRAGRAGLLERPGAHRGALPAGAGPRQPIWRAPRSAVWSGDTVVARRGGLPLLRRPQGRDDQDLRLPGQPDRDRGGRLRHRPGARRGRARRRRRAARPAHRARRQPGRTGRLEPDDAARRAAPRAAALHGAQRVVDRASELPRSPNGKFDRVLLRAGAGRHEPATAPSPRSARVDGQLARRRHPARAARRARRLDAVLRLRPARCSPSGSRCCARRCPPAIELSYAVKANPMPAVVQHLSGPGRLASTSPRPARCRSRSTRAMPPDRVSFAGPGKTAAELAPGGRGRRHDRARVRRPRPSAWPTIGERLGHPAAGRRAGQPRLPGQGLGHAHGRRAAAVRRRRRAGARRCSRASRPTRPRVARASTSSPARRTCNAEILVRGAAQDRRARAAAGRRRARRRSATSTSAAASASPTSRRTSRSTWRAIGDNLARPARRTRSARASRTRASSIELGRYLVGECGVYVTRVVDRKVSRGQDLPRRRRRPAPPARRLGQLRPGDPAQLSGRDRQPHRRATPTETVSVVGCLCTPLDLLADDVSPPEGRDRRPRRRLPGRRLRPDRQPDRLPGPPAPAGGARLVDGLRPRRPGRGSWWAFPGLIASAHLGLRGPGLARLSHPSAGARQELRFLVLVPAHNEERVIGRCLEAIYADRRPRTSCWSSRTDAPTRPGDRPALGARCSSAAPPTSPAGPRRARQASTTPAASSGTPS